MFRITWRDLAWLTIVVVILFSWGYEHIVVVRRQRRSSAVQADLAVTVQRQAQLLEQMRQRLDEYENQYVLMRRLLRVAQQKRD